MLFAEQREQPAKTTYSELHFLVTQFFFKQRKTIEYDENHSFDLGMLFASTAAKSPPEKLFRSILACCSHQQQQKARQKNFFGIKNNLLTLKRAA